jgi:hypothetical protein
MANKIGKERRSLRYDFTAIEIHDKAQQLAKKNKEVQHLEDEKKSVTSQLQARINSAKSDVNVLAGQVADGWEYRNVDCDVLYHTPVQGKKTIVRTDNNLRVGEEPMAQHEWDLFNQPDGNENGQEDITEDTDAEVVGEESGPRLLGNGVDEDRPE